MNPINFIGPGMVIIGLTGLAKLVSLRVDRVETRLNMLEDLFGAKDDPNSSVRSTGDARKSNRSPDN